MRRAGAEVIPGLMETSATQAGRQPHLHAAEGPLSPVARRRLERLRTEYAGLLAEEDHARLEGWADRMEVLSTIVKQIDEKRALETSSL